MAVTAVLFCMIPCSANTWCGEPQDLVAGLRAIWDDEEQAMRYLNGLRSAQLLRLCDQYGKVVDEGGESPEGLLIEVVLGILKGRKVLTSKLLLDVVAREQASCYWRARAARYACGKERFVAFQSTNMPGAVKVYTEVALDQTAPEMLRGNMLGALGSLLAKGYYLILCRAEGREECVDHSLRPRIRAQTLTAWKDHEELVRQFVDLAVNAARDDSTPQIARERTIPLGLRVVLQERGMKTPGLAKIRKLLQEVQTDKRAVLRNWKNLIRFMQRLEAGEG